MLPILGMVCNHSVPAWGLSRILGKMFKVQLLNAEALGKGLNVLCVLLGFNSSIQLCSWNITLVPKWALITVAVAGAILLLLFLICIIKCCCCKKKPKKKERIGLCTVSNSTTTSLVRPALPSVPPPSSLRGLLLHCPAPRMVGAQHGRDTAERILRVVLLSAAGTA